MKRQKLQVIGIFALAGYGSLAAMEQDPKVTLHEKPVLVEEYAYAEREKRPENEIPPVIRFRQYTYADVTFINTTNSPINIQLVRLNPIEKAPENINPGARREFKKLNLDRLKKFDVYYDGTKGSMHTIALETVKTLLASNQSYVVDIIIRPSWTGNGFLEADFRFLKSAEMRLQTERLDESFVGLDHVSLKPDEEQKILFEELGNLVGRNLSWTSQPHDVLGIEAPLHVLKTAELQNDEKKRIYTKLLQEKSDALEKVLNNAILWKQLHIRGIKNSHEKLLKIARSARDHIADYIKAD